MEESWTLITRNCTLRNKCNDEFCTKKHPKNWNWKNNEMCFSPSRCSNKNCEFKHNEGHSWEANTLCEFLTKCTLIKCKYKHKCSFYDCIGKKCIFDHTHEHSIDGVKSICIEIGCIPCDHCNSKAHILDGLCKVCIDKETDKEEIKLEMRYKYRYKYKY